MTERYPFDDGWPDHFGAAWFIWQQEAAREAKALRSLEGDPNADVQFDYEREADEQGCSIRRINHAYPRQSSSGNPRGE
jgi:hypothetical protein